MGPSWWLRRYAAIRWLQVENVLVLAALMLSIVTLIVPRHHWTAFAESFGWISWVRFPNFWENLRKFSRLRPFFKYYIYIHSSSFFRLLKWILSIVTYCDDVFGMLWPFSLTSTCTPAHPSSLTRAHHEWSNYLGNLDAPSAENRPNMMLKIRVPT